MNLNFNKKMFVGVSINSEIGLEVIQIDFSQKKIVKYGRKDLKYDNSSQEVSDLDYFKETLRDLLVELEIPKGTHVVLNIPAMFFKVADYQNALTNDQISDSILEDLADMPAYKDVDLAISVADANATTVQTRRLVSAVVKKTMLIEIAMQIKEIGYKLDSIDVSTNSTLNALICNEKVDTNNDNTWLFLLVENGYCRIITMQGCHYSDCYEEKIAIGTAFGDNENYNTIIDTVTPILNNTPAQYLFIVSKTNLISAELLASKLSVSIPVVHMESNVFSKQSLMETDDSISEDLAKSISIDVIGAGVKPFCDEYCCNINLFNEGLGNIYISEMPLAITINGKQIVLSLENMLTVSIILIIIVLTLVFVIYGTLKAKVIQQKNEISALQADIDKIQAELKANESVSSEIFDEPSEIKIGVSQNKKIYSYYTIVGTEIPKQLWLTKLDFNTHTTIEGQADNLESIYAFYRSIKDYDTTDSGLKLQKLEMASKINNQSISESEENEVDKEATKASVLSSLNADFYQFKISDEVISKNKAKDTEENESEGDNTNTKKNKKPPKFIPSSSLETAE